MHCLTCPVMRFHYTALNAKNIFFLALKISTMMMAKESPSTIGVVSLVASKVRRSSMLGRAFDMLRGPAGTPREFGGERGARALLQHVHHAPV